MTKITPDELVHALESAGYEDIRRDYSGRSMFGKKCIGVIIERETQLYDLGVVIGQAMENADWTLGAPSLDNMGRNLIAYWPSVRTDA